MTQSVTPDLSLFMCLLFVGQLCNAANAPKITLALKDQKVLEGETVVFICKATASPLPKFTWKKNGRTIKFKSKKRYFKHSMPYGSVLRVSEAHRKRDKGLFKCIASNNVGQTQSQASLFVYANNDRDVPLGFPRVITSPTSQAARKTRPSELKCDATGNPTPTISWLKDYKPVDMTNPRFSIHQGSLRISESQESDQGLYVCAAKNMHGVQHSHPVQFYVKVFRYSPRFTTRPKDKHISPGTDVILQCMAVGSPMPKVKWIDGGVDLTQETVGNNTLILKNVIRSNNYTCYAHSDLGHINTSAHVRVNGMVRRGDCIARFNG